MARKSTTSSPHRLHSLKQFLLLSTSTILLILLNFPTRCECTKHTFTTKLDGRFFIAPIGTPYGFLKRGQINVTVFDYELIEDRSAYKRKKKKGEKEETANDEGVLHFEGGFLLKRFKSETDFVKFEEEILEDPSICSFEFFRDLGLDEVTDEALQIDDDKFLEFDSAERSADVTQEGIFLSMKDSKTKWKRNAANPPVPTITHNFTVPEEGLYVLMYQICSIGDAPPFTEVRSTFELDISMHNFDTFGNISYLTAGEMPLPGLFLYFSMSYLICLLWWTKYLQDVIHSKEQQRRSKGVVVHQIHHMMTLLLLLKTLTVFFESVRYHYIRTTGHAEFWSVVYYFFSFLKGVMLFTVILLIGSGWSFVKPFLHAREKNIILCVLILQVIDNIAVVVITHVTEGERLYEDWSAILHLVDILCCCAVLIPIVWQVNSLEQNAESEQNAVVSAPSGEAATTESSSSSENSRSIQKLKLFRSFYLLVIAYIYFTRVVVYLFATILGYRYTWLRYAVTEIGTLAFYCVVGFKFRPEADNPYFKLSTKDEDEIHPEVDGGEAVEMISKERED